MNAKLSHKNYGRQSEKGQLVLEFVLMMSVCVALALVIKNTMVNRDPENPGFMIERWVALSQAIGQDTVDQ